MYQSPTFEREISPSHGAPRIITIRPTYHHASENEAMQVLADFIVHSTQQAVRNYNHRSLHQTLQGTAGYLSATNLVNGNVRAFSKKITSLGLVNFDMIAQILEDIHQSNDHLLLSDIEWRFGIDPVSITVGGGTTSKPPSWAPKSFQPTW